MLKGGILPPGERCQSAETACFHHLQDQVIYWSFTDHLLVIYCYLTAHLWHNCFRTQQHRYKRDKTGKKDQIPQILNSAVASCIFQNEFKVILTVVFLLNSSHSQSSLGDVLLIRILRFSGRILVIFTHVLLQPSGNSKPSFLLWILVTFPFIHGLWNWN